MNRIGITKKLFFITAVVFGLFISSVLIAHTLFFENFYINKKKKELEASLIKFISGSSKLNKAEISDELIRMYEDEYSMKIGILDSSSNIRIVPKMPQTRLDTARTKELYDFIVNWSKDQNNSELLKKNGQVENIVKEYKPYQNRNLISIYYNKTWNEVVFTMSSLQPVNEASTAMSEFLKYFYIVAILLIIVLSLIYSNMITKPLLGISRISTKMASLDFSEKCLIKSNDEIGNVASSLNFLANNLQEALNSLREANAKLARDIEKERQLEKMRKDFVASVSHELKTPISLIGGYAVGLKDDVFEGEDKEYYMDVIIDETRKMGGLVSDMLDLSQLESGSFKLSLDRFNLAELIRYVAKKYSTMIQEKAVTLETQLQDRIIEADWNRMEQVMTNFITNSLRHVEKSGNIYINMINEENFMLVEIENTGSRIPEDELDKIWDKFYKLDKSRNRSLGGTGIGLSIVKNILLLHHYPFGVLNTEKGVKFYFRIPD